MAEEYQLSFTLPQFKALITALVTAAKAAYEVLKAKRQRTEHLK